MKSKIALTFLLALIGLACIGYVGRSTIADLITSVHEASYNREQEVIHELLSDFSLADNAVRTYTITNDANHLYTLSKVHQRITNNMRWLQESTRDVEKQLVDSLQLLVNQKFETMNELIRIKKNKEAYDILDRMSEDVTRIVKQKNKEDTALNPSGGDESTKKGLFDKLFKKKDSESSPENLVAEKPDQDISTDVAEAIAKIRQENNINKKQELQLTIKDSEISKKIRNVVDQIGTRNVDFVSDKTEKAQKATNQAIYIINVVGLSTLILISILILIILNDIDKNRKNRRKLKEAKEHAEKLAKTKEDFLANMSHEIRSPLNAIIGFSEQLKSTKLCNIQAKFLKHISNSSDHLLQVVNDILDYSKLENGKMSIEHIGFNARKTLQLIIDSYKTQAEEKGVTIKTKISEQLPEVIIGDPVRFKQILINLISNSIKFTEEGQIEVSLNWIESLKEGDESYYQLTVSDTGIGIAKSKLNTIFDEFSQEDTSTTRKFGGTGLGLSIVNKIVNAMRGDITVESQQGSGTTFTITVPTTIGTLDDIPQDTKVKIDSKFLEGASILVVDDQEYNLELIKILFEKWGINGAYLNSGEKAVKAFKNNNYDAILMDLQMPDVSGFEATKRIRRIENDSIDYTPIIALSAASLQNQIDKAYKSGVDDYLAKPITEQSLFTKLLRLFNVPINELINEDELEDDSLSEENELAINFNELYELAQGDPRFVRNMLNIFITNFESDFKALRDALAMENYQKVTDKAHKLASPTRHLGIDKLYELLKSIEHGIVEKLKPEEISSKVDRVEEEYRKIKPLLLAEMEKIKMPQL